MINSIKNVISKNYCCGCGTCSTICPKSSIEIKVCTKKGMITPFINNSCLNCGLCLKVCPALYIDYKSLETIRFGKSSSRLEGIVSKTYLGNSTNCNIRVNSASGGIVTSLLLWALESGQIDAVLHVKSGSDGSISGHLAYLPNEIIDNSGSQYHQIALNSTIRTILNLNLKVAVVGLPCHITGITLLEKHILKLKDLIVYKFGLVCNHTPSLKIIEYYSKRYKNVCSYISKRRRYWPGEMKLVFKDGKETTIKYSDVLSWGKLYNHFFWPKRCLFCRDKINRLSDISFMDPYNIPEANKDMGSTLFCTRNEKADILVSEAINNHKIEAEIVDYNYLEQSQDLKLTYKKYIARSNVLKFLNRIVPKYIIDEKEVLKPTIKIQLNELKRIIFNYIGNRNYGFINLIIRRGYKK